MTICRHLLLPTNCSSFTRSGSYFTLASGVVVVVVVRSNDFLSTWRRLSVVRLLEILDLSLFDIFFDENLNSVDHHQMHFEKHICICSKQDSVALTMMFKYAFLSLLLTPLLVVFVPVYEIMHRFGLFDIDRGQRVMICGASSGIGEQIAYQYARKGTHLALIARRPHELSIVAKNAIDLGAASATPIVGDFGKKDENYLQNLVENATIAMRVAENKNYDGLDVLVLNHAVQRWGWLLPAYQDSSVHGEDEISTTSLLGDTWSFDFIEKSLEINLSSFIKLAIVAMPSLVKGARAGGSNDKSRILVVSSGAGKLPCVKQSTYAAAKHGLHGFFDSLRLELEYKSIPVSITNVVLGLIETDTAVSLVKDDVEHLAMGNANDAALAMILAAQARIEEFYYPVSQQLHLATILRSFPGMRYLLDRLNLLLSKGQQN